MFPAPTVHTAEVSARLEIPPAATHVIGDPVALIWHFHNHTERPLAFVWEACCRLNGRLTVRQDGVELPRIPPGPNSAHQFAKPAILSPAGEQRFESMLADWVFITNTGRYELTGHYVGVVPEQRPPVPASIRLWRGEAVTPPAPVELISVPDYLAQRPQRVARRGLDAVVTGPDRLPAVGAATFQLRVRNVGQEPLPLRWPLETGLWLTDAAGIRIFRGPTKPQLADEQLILAPGAERTVEFPVSVDDLNGSGFGDHLVFIDFAEKDGRPRVPATPKVTRWELGVPELTSLLNDAAGGTAIGARNPPLRRLRQYLAASADALERTPTDGLSAGARTLREQLLLAACLSELPVRTGRATVRVAATPGGGWRFAEPLVERCVAGAPTEQLARVLEARRHLGWEIAVNLQPDDSVTAADLVMAARSVQASGEDLATPPRHIVDAPTNVVAGVVNFPTHAPRADLVLRLGADGAGDVSAGHIRFADGAVPAEQWREAPTQRLSAPDELTARLGEIRSVIPQVVVRCDPSLTWSRMRPWLDPLLRRGWMVELVVE